MPDSFITSTIIFTRYVSVRCVPGLEKTLPANILAMFVDALDDFAAPFIVFNVRTV